MIGKQLLISSIILLALDSAYMATFGHYFLGIISEVQCDSVKFKAVPAVLCYMILIMGLNYFVISRDKSLVDAFLLGVLIYGVYELTNYATMSKWSPKMAIGDTLWGGVLLSLTTLITCNLD